MNAASSVQPAAGFGILDAGGRLIEADEPLRGLHLRAGGEEGGFLAVPQIAEVARLARRLQSPVAQTALAADGDRNLEILVRAEPVGSNIRLSFDGWVELAGRSGATASFDRQADLERASVDWTWEVDSELCFTRLSPLAAGMVGRAVADAVGKPLTALFRLRENEDGSLPILLALARREGFDRQVAELRDGDGECVTLAAQPAFGSSGEFLGLHGSVTRLSQALPSEEAPGAASIGKVFGEKLDRALRGPLAQIIEEAEALARQQAGPLGPSYAGYAADIHSAARHLLSLVDDLGILQASGSDLASTLTTINLASAAREAGSLLRKQADERDVSLNLPADEEIAAVGDYRRVVQIIVNLITNAIRYSPPFAEVLVQVSRDNGKASVSVSDRGKGVHPSDQNRIFGKFERLDPSEPGGTGLGLFTSRELARAMGGDIQVESASGKGSRFTLWLVSGE